MSDKKRKGIVQAIATLLEGGMERDRVALYIRETYYLTPDAVVELITVAHHRLHVHRV